MAIRGVLSRDDQELTKPAQPASTLSGIVVALDRSSASQKAVAFATSLAARFGARLHLVHAVGCLPHGPPCPVLDDALVADYFDVARRRLAEERTALKLHPSDQPATVECVRLGQPASEVVAVARERSADLIVTGTRDEPGKHRLESGSVAGEIVLRAHVPVLVVHESSTVPAPGAATFAAPLVAVDYGDASRAALRSASVLSRSCPIDVVHAIRDPELALHPRARALEQARAELERWVQTALAGPRLPVRPRIAVGAPAAAVCDFAVGGGYDLVACGTHGRRPNAPLVGSVAEALLDATSCPVLVLREARIG